MEQNSEQNSFVLRLTAVWSVFAISFITISIKLVYLHYENLRLLVVNNLTEFTIKLGIIAGSTVAAILLFHLRRTHMRVYAYGEISFAFATIWHLAGSQQHDSYLPFLASIYLMVRGFVNFNASLAEKPS